MLIDPETGEPFRPCRPMPIRAVCDVPGCGYADDADGQRSTAGREALRKYLLQGREPDPTPPGHCDCRRCRDHGREPSTPEETDDVLHHLTDRTAVLFLLGYAHLSGCVTCEHCGGLAALFQDGGTWPGLIKAGCCPYHHHLAGVPFGGDR